MLQMMLQKRSNGYYYFRWVCPPAIRNLLGKREIIKSLRTSSKTLALARAGDLYALVSRLKAYDREITPATDFHMLTTDQNMSLLDELKANQAVINDYLRDKSAKILFQMLKKEPIESLPLADLDDLNEEELKEFQIAQQRFLIMLLDQHVPTAMALLIWGAKRYQPDGYKEAQTANLVIPALLDFYKLAKTNRRGEVASNGLRLRDVIDKSMQMGGEGTWFFSPLARVLKLDSKLYDLFLSVLQETFHANLEAIMGNFEESNLRSGITSNLDRMPSRSQNVAPVVKHVKKILLKQLYSDFLAHKTKEGLSNKIKKDYNVYFSGVFHFLGDVSIETISKTKLKECLSAYSNLPVRNRREYKGKSIAELIAISIPDDHKVSSKVVIEVKKLLQGLFRFAVDKEYLTVSPATDLNIRFEKTAGRGSFSKTQVSILLKGAEELAGVHEWKQWIIRLAAYTGARAGELAQLRGEDIRCDEDSGLYYILITPKAGRLKTPNAFRTVPLHSRLIELGFLNFINKDGRIFASNVNGQAISKWFPLFATKCGIPNENDYGESLTFHSFRHSFITNLRASGANDTQVQQIVGHERTSAGLTDNYTHRITIADLKPIIELIKY